ncbi:DUF2156 domain-containing protein [Desulfovibrio sp. JC010]|uniref:DUF2156 domain-containing protein n=1 Tax=Desulfovibrio sp. JC010 TaxID=2593641 RepID=UPI0013D063B8|nr:DUF2156 domain-containing protein [Desulfovibrio sp. JC010]
MNLNRTAQFRFLLSDDPLAAPALLPYLKIYGNRCMSYSTTQPGLKHALLESVGYISWLEINPLFMGKHAVILSEPVAPPELQVSLIKRLERHLGKLTLVQIGEPLAAKLHEQGYSVYQIGVESELDIQSFNLDGKHKNSLRRWRNKALNSGVVVEESLLSETNCREVEEICHDWLKGKGGKELSFLTRPMPKTDEDGVRFFWARQGDELLGFSGFDPMYDNGRTIGYYHNFDRICSGAVNGTSPFTLLQAMDKFRSEGKKTLSLGLSPLYGMDSGYNLVGPLQKIAQLFYEYGEKIYPFKGNAGHKAKFCGRKKKVYVASNAGWFRTMVAAATACGLEVKNQLT